MALSVYVCVLWALILTLFIGRWGLGPIAQKKKGLIKEGKLDKYGRKNEKTPADYLALQGASNGAAAAAEEEVKKESKKEKKHKKEVSYVCIYFCCCICVLNCPL